MKAGDQFGHLTVLREVGRNKSGYRQFECRCNCGNVCVKRVHNIRIGLTCGRKCPEYLALVAINHTTHGLRKHSLYPIWVAMKQRCQSPTNPRWDCYGGRGITVCDEWLSFENFYKDMAPSYAPGLQIDRIDNNAGYSKENCRWATRKENNRNRRCCITPGWVLDEAAKNGISRKVAYDRIRLGWDPQRACTQPVRPQHSPS